MRKTSALAVTMLLLAGPAVAASLQSDCRAPGSIGTATLSPDGTITLNVHQAGAFDGALAYKKNDPNYARMLSHIGGLSPGEKKPLPAFCSG